MFRCTLTAEHADIENSDTADTRSDQSGSEEEIPTTSPALATSISWIL